jgi:hypothetical protein
MLIRTYQSKNSIIIFLVLISFGISNATEPNKSTDEQFKYLPRDNAVYERSDIRKVADALGFQNWPKTNIWRVAPDINISMFTHPEQITWEHKSYGQSHFLKDYWGYCHWSIDFNGVRLNIDISNTPNSTAAHEMLLGDMTNSQMEYHGIIAMYQSAEKLSDLGTMNYVLRHSSSSIVYFVRDNILVTISGEKIQSDEVLITARKIDSAIINSPALTYEQLISRRPVLEIKEDFGKVVGRKQRDVSYKISAPNGIKVMSTWAEGGEVQKAEHRINLPEEEGPAEIKLFAVTNELLVGYCEKTINVPPWEGKIIQ